MKKLLFLSILLCLLIILIDALFSADWEKHVIGDQSSPIYLYVKDMDGDSDLDVASATNRHPLKWDSEVAWFRNNLDQNTPWIQHVLSDTFSGTDIYTGDIHGDLKTDLVVSGAFIDQLAWFEYRSEDGHIVWTEHMIDDTINDPGDVSLDDLDGDGDLDVVVTGLREDQMISMKTKSNAARRT